MDPLLYLLNTGEIEESSLKIEGFSSGPYAADGLPTSPSL